MKIGIPHLLIGLIAVSSIEPAYKHLTTTPEQRAAERAEKIRYQAAVDASKKAGDMNRFVLTADQRTRCRQQIQQAMHNPSSFRWEGSMSDMRRTGVLVYSGTNAFGGRVRETYKCA